MHLPANWRPWLSERLPLAGEILRGAGVGCICCAVITQVAGGPIPTLPLALIGGSAAGALIGLLLWCGASDQYEDPVLPPPRYRGPRRPEPSPPYSRRR